MDENTLPSLPQPVEPRPPSPHDFASAEADIEYQLVHPFEDDAGEVLAAVHGLNDAFGWW